MTKPRIKLPESAKVGEVIEIKTLISHVMETGQRKDADGKTDPAQHHQHLHRQVRGRRGVQGRAAPRHLGQPLPVLLHEGAGPGRVRVHLDRGRRAKKIVEKAKLNVA